MAIYKPQKTSFREASRISLFIAALTTCIIATGKILAQDSSRSKTDIELIKNYVQSEGKDIILFDSSNIKQFWIDNTVVSKNGSIVISLNQKANNVFESKPLRIQLANVDITQECIVDVFTENEDMSFTVINTDSKAISQFSAKEDFIGLHEISSTFRLIETKDNIFNLQFKTSNKQTAIIKAIVLSFLNKKSFPAYPGYLRITSNNIQCNAEISSTEDKPFLQLKGKDMRVSSDNKIRVSDNTLSSFIKVKNTNDEEQNVYFGYEPYTKNGVKIDNRTVPYKNNNKILKVLSSEANSNTIIVDIFPEWEEKCFLALNAKEDLSDFPNMTFAEGSIQSVKKIDNNKTEITLNKPQKKAIPAGTLVRVQSPHGASCIWVNIVKLQPGEETILLSTIRKKDSSYLFSSAGFCRGTDSVLPVLYMPSKKEISVEISEYTIVY